MQHPGDIRSGWWWVKHSDGDIFPVKIILQWGHWWVDDPIGDYLDSVLDVWDAITWAEPPTFPVTP